MSNLPQQLLESLQNVPGFSEEAFKAVHQSAAQVTSVRLNPEKIINNQYSIFNLQSGKVPWSSNGYYLTERPSFTLDPLFHAGVYYVQEASSMFLEEALRQTADLTAPSKVLDLCAAPGGKSTHIQSLISKESLLVSNEVIKTRVNILAENITKWGGANVIVTNNDPKDFQRLQNYFDVIVVDAPCSGSGLFRKDARAISEWSESNVALCAQRQQRILADIIPSLKAGGILIYSTCSYSKSEDEDIADWLVSEMKVESLQLKLEEEWGIVETVSERTASFGYRFYPDKLKGEGFFIAAFRNTAGNESRSETQSQSVKDKKEAIVTVKETEVIMPYLADPAACFFIKQNEDLIALPLHLEDELGIIQSSLYIKKAGVRLGTVIRNELLPAHDLAVSTIIHPTVPKLEADYETALQYLRKTDIRVESDSKGWSLLSYRQQPLGWIKILSGRINNYYPKEWRILNK